MHPGFNGDEKAPNHANYDESKAAPFPDLPDPLTLNNGGKVTTAKMWWDQRRPEILDMYEKEVYGRIPKDVPKVTWTVTAVDHETIGFNPVIAKDLIGQVDNSAYPATARPHAHDCGYAGKRQRASPGFDDVRPRRISSTE